MKQPRVRMGRTMRVLEDSLFDYGPVGAVDARYVWDRRTDPSSAIGVLYGVADEASRGKVAFYRWVPGTPWFPRRDGLPDARDHAQVQSFREYLEGELDGVVVK